MTDGAGDAPAATETQRLDRWLWFARLVKSRTLAASLIEAGKVRVNAVRVIKPSHAIRVSDALTVAVHSTIKIVRVENLGTRRGPAAEAQSLYSDLTPQRSPAEGGLASSKGVEVRSGGRPTKRDRRLLDRLKEPLP